MTAPQKPSDEVERLAALKGLQVLDTPINKGFERITRLTKALFKTPIVAISLVDDERQWFKSIQGLDVCETSREVSFCGHAILQDDIFLINDTLLDLRFANNPLVTADPKIRFYAGYPVRSKSGYKIGTLCIIDQQPRDFKIEDLEALKDMASLVEEELTSQKKTYAQSALIEELDEAKRSSLIDPLTRLWNRGAIENILFKQLVHSKANNKSFGIAMIDIDNFKDINDTHGHNTGDHVLRQISKILLDSLRAQDTLGRWGGEEFLAIVETESRQKLFDIMERAREKFTATKIKHDNQNFTISFTCGITLYHPSSECDLLGLVELVDKALYQGKKSGKNKIICID